MVLEKISNAVIDPDPEKVEALVKEALDAGHRPKDIIDNGLIKGMDVVGRMFKENEVFIPEVLMSARAMHAGLSMLKPLLTDAEESAKGVFVIATVKGDVHDIGKNLVAMMFEGAGFKVVDLGVDVPKEKVVEAVKENDADLVGLSTLLTTGLDTMKETIDAIEEAGLRENVKIIVGGAAVTQSEADDMKAHGYAENANLAVDRGKELLNVDR
jgi:corrinoid protein of di/trimethylamine methyltransferase